MPVAMARHILVKTEAEAAQLKQRLAKGEDFATLAKKHSTCPSGKRGGDLGEVRPGQMVRSIDNAIFRKPVGVLQGPLAAFCLQLPGAREDLKWGSNRVFSVAGNKMFAILDFVDKDGGLAFKVGSELFLGYVDRPGIRPAPYLARAHWIVMARPYPMKAAELREALVRSHQLVVARLPKRQRLGLVLDA